MEALAVGTYLTPASLARRGCIVDELCQWCGMPDTIRHRLWQCSHPPVAEARERAGEQVVAMAAAAQAGDPLFARGVPESVRLELPSAGPIVVCSRCEPQGWRKLPALSPDLFTGGPVFTDGSLVPAAPRGLERASWCAYAPAAAGRPAVVAQGTVPWPLQQTSPAAEWCGWAGALALGASGPEDLYTDCQFVKDWLDKPIEIRLRPNFAFAGTAKEGLLALQGRAPPAVRKVKAHAREKGLAPQDQQEADLWDGNQMADEGAKEAQQLARPCPQDRRREAETTYNAAIAVCKLAVQVLPLWEKVAIDKPPLRPAVRGQWGPEPQPAEAQCGEALRGHDWAWALGRWQCLRCLRIGRGQERPGRGACPGRSLRLAGLLAGAWGRGHRLHALAFEDASLVICVRCGGYSSGPRSTLLEGRCSGRAVGPGRQQLRRAQRGLHPRHSCPAAWEAAYDLGAAPGLGSGWAGGGALPGLEDEAAGEAEAGLEQAADAALLESAA